MGGLTALNPGQQSAICQSRALVSSSLSASLRALHDFHARQESLVASMTSLLEELEDGATAALGAHCKAKDLASMEVARGAIRSLRDSFAAETALRRDLLQVLRHKPTQEERFRLLIAWT